MFFYEPLSGTAIVSVLLYLVFLIGMNELSRLNKWVGGAIFIALPTVLTIFVWPHTAVEGTGAGTWFQWVKTYSCLAGAILGWLIVYFFTALARTPRRTRRPGLAACHGEMGGIDRGVDAVLPTFARPWPSGLAAPARI